MEGSRYRLAETLGALSLATDLAAGSTPETALGATVASVRIGRGLGLSASDLADIYYASLLRFVGCTATATEIAALALGADQSASYAVSMCDWVDPDQVEASMDTYLPRDVAETQRREALAAIRANHEGIPDQNGSPVFLLRENATLISNHPEYAWLNPLQVWAPGTVDVSKGEVQIKAYAD